MSFIVKTRHLDQTGERAHTRLGDRAAADKLALQINCKPFTPLYAWVEEVADPASPRPLVDQETGEIDRLAIAERAQLRAASEYGSPNFPPAYLRMATEWCTDRARLERFDWRRARGLPSDESATMVAVPSWGASGDSFGSR